jgi:alginate O-acetyltransferase complex protein AlgI
LSFISSEFAILLAITVVAASVLRTRRAAALIVLAASFVFYGWWNASYLLLLAAVIAISWIGALAIERWRSRSMLAIVVGAELALLVYFKYAGFVVRNVVGVASAFGYKAPVTAPDILLPAGISFMTFQGVAYAVDVYRREFPAERSLFSVALFKSFFPQLVAGPIERAAHLLPQLRRLESEGVTRASFGEGTLMVLKGVLLKFVIADNLSVVVDSVYGNVRSATPADVALAVLAFSVQIYCDFYGYTMIALGSARLLGVDLIQNFTHPYLATSIQDFWRRWHISLSQWFRDYLYIPLGGSRVSPARHVFNLLLVMLAVGLWHGASWTFVAWGGLHGLMLAVNTGWRRFSREIGWTGVAGGRLVAWAATFACVTLAWIPFRAADWQTMGAVGGKLAAWLASPRSSSLSIYGAGFYVAVLLFFVAFEALDAAFELERGILRMPAAVLAVTVFAACALTYFAPFKDVAFLYFQF